MDDNKRLKLINFGENVEESIRQLADNELAAQQQPLGDAGRTTPLENTIRHAVRLGARAGVLQLDVQDPDFWAEHSSYYSKWPFKVPRFCVRLHLFSKPAASSAPLEALLAYSQERELYLGFITFRPIGSSPIGATILKVDSESDYITSRDYFRVNLAGYLFIVEGTPFLQQDNAVGACAQASIWMALRTLRRREGQAAFDPAQITLAATRFLVSSRTLPNRSGLRIEQITEAVRSAGFSPHSIPLRPPGVEKVENLSENDQAKLYDTIKHELYPYVESGIPVILALQGRPHGSGHAVLLIGHGWNRDATPDYVLHTIASHQSSIPCIDASTWTDPLLVHNDNTGPYLALSKELGNTYALIDAFSAIPFLPSDVFIDGEEARTTSIKLLIELDPIRWTVRSVF